MLDLELLRLLLWLEMEVSGGEKPCSLFEPPMLEAVRAIFLTACLLFDRVLALLVLLALRFRFC